MVRTLYSKSLLRKRSLTYLPASSASAVQNATFCPTSTDICYVVNVPESTASNGGEGDLYFQISAPSTMRWIGFGQGSQMAGANMFVIYADEAGTNITLSPRHGISEIEPLLDQTTNVTLLEGSGISNGQMVANILCECIAASRYVSKKLMIA